MFEITNAQYTRQLDLIPMDSLDVQINIIGAGAIGSFTALSLVKMGFTNLVIFDDDKIDIENMNCQFYRMSDIGKQKVFALKELIKDFTNVEIDVVNEKWNGSELSGIVLSCVDKMEVRKELFNVHKKSLNCKLFVDTRMGAETALLFTVRPYNLEDIGGYEKTLYTDENAVQERCTSKSTIYCSLSISALLVSTIKSFLIDKKVNTSIMFDVKNSDMITYRKDV